MSFIGSMFSGSHGAGFEAQGADTSQQNTAYNQTQQGLGQQQDFVNALMTNGGLSNQADVFNQQQALANQLQGLANGVGPNPAQTQLAQATGQNVQNQAALMAGQRGASANPGLLARLAAQQGGNIQQQAAGQAATLGAQQQIAAMQQLQNQQANLANMANAQLGQRQTGLSALNSAALQQQGNLLGIQGNANSVNGQIAAGNQASQSGLLGGLLGGAGAGLVGGLFGANGGQVPEIQGNPLLNPIGHNYVAEGSPGAQSKTAQALANQFNSMGGAGGGGNSIGAGSNLLGNALGQAGGKYLGGLFGSAAGSQGGLLGGGVGADLFGGGAGDAGGLFGGEAGAGLFGALEGGGVGAGLGEAAGAIGEGLAAIAPVVGEAALAANQGGMIDGQQLANEKEMVPGQAEVKGDSLRNDKVPAILSPKEIVIPRSIALHPNAPELAKQFVADVIAKNKRGGNRLADGGQPSDGDQQQPTVVINNGPPQGNSPFAISGPQAQALGSAMNTPQQANQQAMMQSPQFQQKAAQDAQNRAALQAMLPKMPQMPGPNDAPDAGAPQAGKSPMDLFGIDASNAAYAKGMGDEIHGLDLQRQAQTNMAAGNVARMEPMIQQRKDQFNEYKTNVDNLMRERETFLKDYQDSKVDPNHFMANLNPLQKFGTAIGLALGGMGSGLTHQPNAALDFLNKQIDRDIQGQLQNREAKGNLLKANMEQFHNMRDAVEMTRIQMTDLMTNEMALEAQKQGGLEADARYRVLKGGFEKQNADRIGSMAMRNVMMQAQSGMGPAGQLPIQTRINLMRSVDPAKAKDLESRYVPGVDALADVPLTPEARKEIIARNDLQDKLERLQQFAEKHQGTVMDRATVQQGTALAKQAQDAYRTGHNQGVYKESEKEFVEGVINSDPTAFFGNFRTIPGYKSAVSENRKSINNIYNQFGIRLGQNVKNFEGAPKLGR